MATLGRSPGAAPLTTADIPDDSITGAKIVDDAIDSEHYAAGSVDAAHVAADVATQAELDAIASVPSNLVAYRASGESTPSGWSEYTTARGRMVVGLPSGGTDGGTVGTALTNVQDKTHTHTGPSHRHNLSILAGTGIGTAQIGWNDHLGNTGSNAAGYYVASANTGAFSGTNYGYNYTSYEGTGATGTQATSDVLAYIQLMTIKKD